MIGIIRKDSRLFIKTKKSGEFCIWKMHEGVLTFIHFVIANRCLLLTEEFGSCNISGGIHPTFRRNLESISRVYFK
jgi:hypothetical protein